MVRNDRVPGIEQGVSEPSDRGPDDVAFAAIRGRSKRLEATDEIAAEQAGQIDDLEAENAELRDQLAAVEEHLDVAPRKLASQSQEASADG